MEDDGVDLSGEQVEKLIHFQDLTMIEDLHRCKVILERYQWNIESAVTDTLNERDVVDAHFSTPVQPNNTEPRMPSMNLTPRDQHVYVTTSSGPQGVVQWMSYAFMLPFRYFFTTVFNILKFAYRLFWPDPRQNVTDPVGDVMAFINKFKDDFGNTHPVFYQGSYSQAINDAKRELETLCNPNVVNFINSKVLFWACNVSSPEGYRVSRTIRVIKYPFLSLIVLRENNSMTVVARIEGLVDSQELIRRLQRAIEVNEQAVTSIRRERERRNADKELREQQDEAYYASLKADQEKDRKKQEAQRIIEEQELEKREQAAASNRLLMELEKEKAEARLLIPPEPPANAEDTVRIILTVPSGAHLERRFNKHTSLKYLYYFILCHESCPDDFKVLMNFPKGEVCCIPTKGGPDPPTFSEVGLDKSVRLFVHDNQA
ncbi:FAS-associated factor 2 [Octopus bimaculoides]|uniref:FAS-associated factor 2 n=1 Tax=Octopus bimaculoides TaxID=37653 RepID=UPI00071D073A|nr:FAS-associated factor 2 [Octopus bimaculoides]|eukprot:XP_014784881.1 PREDICTED: FAS-associated factor 2-like [Octopus bimaculoides]